MKEPFAMLPLSLIESEIYRSLTAEEMRLLSACIMRAGHDKKPRQIAANDPLLLHQISKEKCFCITAGDAARFMRQDGTLHKQQLYRAISTLEKDGFIKTIRKGTGRKPNIYKLSSEWENWSAPPEREQSQ